MLKTVLAETVLAETVQAFAGGKMVTNKKLNGEFAALIVVSIPIFTKQKQKQ